MIPALPDFGLIGGETVTVRTPSYSFDENMDEAVEWSDAVVRNVLVAPAPTSDVTGTTRPHGTRVAFGLSFPKTFTAPLRGCKVVVRGVECDVVGDPQRLADANTPGPWNMTVTAEAVHG